MAATKSQKISLTKDIKSQEEFIFGFNYSLSKQFAKIKTLTAWYNGQIYTRKTFHEKLESLTNELFDMKIERNGMDSDSIFSKKLKKALNKINNQTT